MSITITPLDKMFSYYIRFIRDSGKCQRCRTQYKHPTSGLHCSHYHTRRKHSTRFDPDNVIAACYGCHQWFGENRSAYTDFMKARLGQGRYSLLHYRFEHGRRPDYKGIKLWLETAIRHESDGILGRKA